MNIYDFKVKNMDGSMKDLKEYKGKVLLIINSATHCGFTPQYTELEELYSEFKDQGFEILDFPCNQFAKEAPEEIDELHEFCVLNYNISFPQFDKIDVNGDDADPLFIYLKSEVGIRNIKWNFTKFLVDRNGKVIRKYSSMKKPMKIRADIAKLL